MNVLFIANTRIGDAVLASGVLGHVLECRAGVRATVVCGPDAAPLFAAAPGVEETVGLAKRRFNRHWWQLWRRLAGRRWDLLVDLRNSAMPWLLRARRRKILKGGGVRSHKVVQLARLFGLDPPPPPRLWIDERHRARARELVGAGPLLALGPTATWRGKEWPAARFAALAQRLTGAGGALAGARVAVLGAAGDRAAAAPLLAALAPGRAVDLVGRAGLMEAAAALERASLFVGNDSGPMHLAAAAGAPTLGLFGPSRDEVYAPWGDAAAVVRTPESRDALRARPDYERRAGGSLMESLEADAVAEAAEALLRRVGSRGR